MEFKFAIKVAKPKRTPKQKSIYTRIEKNVEGVCYVDIEGHFACICNNKILPSHLNLYCLQSFLFLYGLQLLT